MRIDAAGHDQTTTGIDYICPGWNIQIGPDGGDGLAIHEYVGPLGAVGCDHSPPLICITISLSS